ncbi:microcin C7 resistance MccF related protein [Ligilactobacillus salitolerans]|uniref:Microcin C7 resistance MccF related protein n=1 Tax=Ligilactobacillus salitolerans TaxID=1808352 RepID=A0A401IQF6_9LACO|nr:S66 peptidase family protein [Ligilactobacillus salitolerans]GBG93768.1 microcin C7 resistance MccF related protein [Ligilactobacillus salitolerans]
MDIIKPVRLKCGDEIRIIAPSDSLARVGGMEANLSAKRKLEDWGYQVSFGENVEEVDLQGSSAITSRVSDLHQAFADDHVKAILTVIGGTTSNELLPYLDYELIAQHPKIICGFSDFTALCNAITARTGIITYYGPAYATLKMHGQQGRYQDQYWRQVLGRNGSITLNSSKTWTSDAWYDDTITHDFQPNEWKVYNSGEVEGVTAGGNLNTLYLLQGTPYQPQLDDRIILGEFAEEGDWSEFSRILASLLQVAPHPRALILGRFPRESQMTEKRLLYILGKFPELKKIPVMYNVNFGHAQPIFTIPIGAELKVDTRKKELTIL